MASRRMITASIYKNNNFLRLTPTAQNLYTHLMLNCDDDGICDGWIPIMVMASAKQEDVETLKKSKYILYDKKNDLIIIKHWWLHNTKRKDRYKPSTHLKDLKLYLDENNAYTFAKTNRQYTKSILNEEETDNQMATTRQPNGNQMATQNRIDKNRIDKNRIKKENDVKEKDTITQEAKTYSLEELKAMGLPQEEIDYYLKNGEFSW